MDCWLVELPQSIKYLIQDGVVYLNALYTWAALEKALEASQDYLSNDKKPATLAT